MPVSPLPGESAFTDRLDIFLIDPTGDRSLWRSVDRSQVEFFRKKCDYLANTPKYEGYSFYFPDFPSPVPCRGKAETA